MSKDNVQVDVFEYLHANHPDTEEFTFSELLPEVTRAFPNGDEVSIKDGIEMYLNDSPRDY